jgi:hypothetical protein
MIWTDASVLVIAVGGKGSRAGTWSGLLGLGASHIVVPSTPAHVRSPSRPRCLFRPDAVAARGWNRHPRDEVGQWDAWGIEISSASRIDMPNVRRSRHACVIGRCLQATGSEFETCARAFRIGWISNPAHWLMSGRCFETERAEWGSGRAESAALTRRSLAGASPCSLPSTLFHRPDSPQIRSSWRFSGLTGRF